MLKPGMRSSVQVSHRTKLSEPSSDASQGMQLELGGKKHEACCDWIIDPPLASLVSSLISCLQCHLLFLNSHSPAPGCFSLVCFQFRIPSYPHLLIEQFFTLPKIATNSFFWLQEEFMLFSSVLPECCAWSSRSVPVVVQRNDLFLCLSPPLNCEPQRAVTVRFIFVALVPGVVVVRSRHLINVSCKKRIQSGCNLSQLCQCPQLRIIPPCPRGCCEDKCDNITKAWERRAAGERGVLLLAVYCLLKDHGTLHLPGAGCENWKKS